MLTSCTSWLSKCRTPRTGDVGRSPTAPASLSAASPPVTPAEPAVTDQQVLYPDEHAQKLAELEPIPYHMPETAVAPLLGFGDDVTALRRWVRKMDSHGGIWAFQAYEDTYLDKGKGPRYWIIGNCFKPTAADAGINCTVSEQLTVTGILQAEAKAVRYGLGQLDEELAGASVANTWFGVLQDIAHAHPEVFNLQSVVNADRPNRREITKAYIAAIKEMLKLKVFALDPEPRTPKQAVDKPPTSSAAAAEPARAASAPDTLPRRLRFKDPDAAGHDRRALQCVCVKGGVSAVAAGEKQGLVAQQLQLEDAASPPGRYQASSRAQAAVMTVSKAIGKPKRVHETLSHGALNLSIKRAENVSYAYFERLLGSRGDNGLLANAGPTLQELMDTGDWGAIKWVDTLDAFSGSTNEMHKGIRQYATSDTVMAQLRVWSLVHHFIVRPLQTYTQNHASQADIIPVMNEYKSLLEKLKGVTDLKEDLVELPWLTAGGESNLISVASSPQVLRSDKQRDKLLQRRRAALKQIKNFDGMSEERKKAQMGLIPVVLRQMAAGMLDGLTRMMDPKYSSLWSLTAEQIANSELDLIPATSDSIERYFGLASWLYREAGRKTKLNTNFQLSIIETKLGTKLVDMFA